MVEELFLVAFVVKLFLLEEGEDSVAGSGTELDGRARLTDLRQRLLEQRYIDDEAGDDTDIGDSAVSKEQTGNDQDSGIGQIGYELHRRLDQGTDRLRLVQDRTEQVVLSLELLYLLIFSVERLDNKLTGVVFFYGSVDFAEELLVLIEQRQGELEGERNDDQHDGERAYDDERHLPAGDEHRGEYADEHNAGLYQHTDGVLQGGAEDIDVVGDNGEDITGLSRIKVIQRHVVDLAGDLSSQILGELLDNGIEDKRGDKAREERDSDVRDKNDRVMGNVAHIDNEFTCDSFFADRRDLVGQVADHTGGQDREDDRGDQQDDRDDERSVIRLERLYKTTQLVLFFSRSIYVCTHNPNSSLLSCDNAIS